MFKKTKWARFKSNFATRYASSVPGDRNLTNGEITEHLTDTQSAIREVIEHDVPRYRPSDSVSKYMNRKTRSLHKDQSHLVTRPNWLLRHNHGTPLDKYWSAQHRSINHRHSSSFFPKINRFF